MVVEVVDVVVVEVLGVRDGGSVNVRGSKQ